MKKLWTDEDDVDVDVNVNDENNWVGFYLNWARSFILITP